MVILQKAGERVRKRVKSKHFDFDAFDLRRVCARVAFTGFAFADSSPNAYPARARTLATCQRLLETRQTSRRPFGAFGASPNFLADAPNVDNARCLATDVCVRVCVAKGNELKSISVSSHVLWFA